MATSITTMPVRYIRDYTQGPNGNHWIELHAYSNGENVALGKTVTIVEGNITGWFGTEVVTDGIQGNFLEVVPTGEHTSIQVDLGDIFDIEEVKVWHYYADGRTYNGTKTEISEDGINWITIFDSKISGEYAETPEGNTIFLGGEIRYIRDWAAGSNVNGACVWLEIEANRQGENVALNKEVTPSVGMSWGHYQVTDGSFNMNNYTWQMTYAAPQYVQIDLGQIYTDLEEIKVWHYPDGRIFNHVKLEVSADGINWRTLFNSDVTGTYTERPQGRSFLFASQAPPAQNFEQTAQLNISMSEDAAKTYTAKGYNHSRWTLNYLDYYFYAYQDYTAINYEFIGADSQEIIFDFGAIQDYTPQGYHFEQSTNESIFIDYIGAQTFTAEGYDKATMAQENILLVSVAAQIYTPIGYHYEAAIEQLIPKLTQDAAQIFAAHFKQFGTQNIGLGEVANTEYQANFRATATEPIFITDTAAQTVVFSEGLQFQENAQENVNITHGAAQTFTPFGGYSYSQNGTNAVNLSMAALLVYELGEIGKNSQRAALYLHLQESPQITYTRNWLEFEAAATIDIVLTWWAESEHTKANLFEATVGEPFYLHHTDKTLHEVVYLSYNQNMFYDLLFWHYADSTQIVNHLEFTGRADENTSLSITASVQYSNPKTYEAAAKLTITLTIKNWVYFESDIYRPTYKIEVEKPNTLWEPTDEDRPTPYIFGRNPNNKIDRRILHLTDITEPQKISYEKPNTLYTHKLEIERGLVDD